MNENVRQQVVQAPGFLWFVHSSRGPVRVDERELAAVRRLLESGLQFDPLPNIQVGDEVEVVGGAMHGCRGHLHRKDANAIILLVSAVNGAIRVSLPAASSLRPIG